MLNRRDFLSSTAVLATTALAAAPLRAAPGQPAELNVLLDTFFQEDLQQNPESATQLGLDKGANAALKSRLRDESAVRHRRRQGAERRPAPPPQGL